MYLRERRKMSKEIHILTQNKRTYSRKYIKDHKIPMTCIKYQWHEHHDPKCDTYLKSIQDFKNVSFPRTGRLFTLWNLILWFFNCLGHKTDPFMFSSPLWLAQHLAGTKKVFKYLLDWKQNKDKRLTNRTHWCLYSNYKYEIL